jgi:hypothetical protein
MKNYEENHGKILFFAKTHQQLVFIATAKPLDQME